MKKIPPVRAKPTSFKVFHAFLLTVGCLGLAVSFSPEAHSAYIALVSKGELPRIQIEGINTPPNDPLVAQTHQGQALIEQLKKISHKYVGQQLNLIPWSNAQCAAFIRFIYREAGIELPLTIAPLDGLPLNGSPYLASELTRSLDIFPADESHDIVKASLAGSDIGAVIEDINDVKPGDLIFYACTYGNWCEKHGRPIITHIEFFDGENVIGDRSGTVRKSPHATSFQRQFYVAVRLDYDTIAQENNVLVASFLRRYGIQGVIVVAFLVLGVNYFCEE